MSPVSFGFPDADFIQVVQQIGRVLVDPVGSSAFKLIPTVSAREQPDTKCLGAAGCEKIPDVLKVI